MQLGKKQPLTASERFAVHEWAEQNGLHSHSTGPKDHRVLSITVPKFSAAEVWALCRGFCARPPPLPTPDTLCTTPRAFRLPLLCIGRGSVVPSSAQRMRGLQSRALSTARSPSAPTKKGGWDGLDPPPPRVRRTSLVFFFVLVACALFLRKSRVESKT